LKALPKVIWVIEEGREWIGWLKEGPKVRWVVVSGRWVAASGREILG
jgi:hypothetical protein